MQASAEDIEWYVERYPELGAPGFSRGGFDLQLPGPGIGARAEGGGEPHFRFIQLPFHLRMVERPDNVLTADDIASPTLSRKRVAAGRCPHRIEILAGAKLPPMGRQAYPPFYQ